jgi:methylisocitrate lyase
MEPDKSVTQPEADMPALAARFRKMLAAEQAQVIPGVVDVITAKVAHKEGFKALYFSGAALAISMGLPNPGLISLTELATAVRRIISAVRAPLIVDVDFELGESGNLARTVVEMESAGAAAILLDDQATANRDGHPNATPIIRIEPMLRTLAAAKAARRGELVIIARTDGRTVEGLATVIDRARLYLEAGADAIFPESLEGLENFSEFAKRVNAPLVANLAESGKTPSIDAYALGELGYKAVLFPHSPFRVALKGVANAYRKLRRSGTQQSLLDAMMTQREIDDLIDYNASEEIGRETTTSGR